MNKTKTIEQLVAEAILDKATATIDLNGHTYEIAPPTPATLILISSFAAQMPAIDRNTDSVLFETLRTAKDMQPIGRIAAALILGAKRIRENRKVEVATKKEWSWKRMRHVTKKETMTEMDYVARTVLEEVSPKMLAEVIGKRLLDMQVGDFFGLSTSLSAVNITKATREVEETASGD